MSYKGGFNLGKTEDDSTSIETIIRCDKITCEKVAIEKCKSSTGEVTYRLENSPTTVVNISDYDLCEGTDNNQDIKEYIVNISTGGTEQSLNPADSYDIVSLDNKSNCPVLVEVELKDKTGATKTRKVKLSPLQVRVFDWSTDAISDIKVGQCSVVTTGVTDVDTLTFISATDKIEVVITLLNS